MGTTAGGALVGAAVGGPVGAVVGGMGGAAIGTASAGPYAANTTSCYYTHRLVNGVSRRMRVCSTMAP